MPLVGGALAEGDAAGLAELAKAGVIASFDPEPVKRALLEEIDNYLKQAS